MTSGKEERWEDDCPSHAAAAVGGEAAAYLQFIVDHWSRLPGTIVFLHSHGCASEGATTSAILCPRECLVRGLPRTAMILSSRGKSTAWCFAVCLHAWLRTLLCMSAARLCI